MTDEHGINAQLPPQATPRAHRLDCPTLATEPSATDRPEGQAIMTSSVHTQRLGRCDRCGAAAQIEVTLTAGDLRLCGHHWHKHKSAILASVTQEAVRQLAS